ESLYLMLTSGAREVLRSVEYVIVDEIHAVAGTKRGAHLALSLERLERLSLQRRAELDADGSGLSAAEGGTISGRRPMTARSPQRIGLSATQRPLDEIARFLGGRARDGQGEWRPRPVSVVDAGVRKPLDLEVVV